MTYEKKERDSQKQRVYDAERKAAKSMAVAGDRNLRIPEIADVEKYVNDIVRSAYWKAMFPKTTIVMVDEGRKGRRMACWKSWEKTIHLPSWARTELIILHELAHAAHDGSPDWDWTQAAHGWQFCAVYLQLVQRYLGRSAHDILAASFKLGGVRYQKPRAKRVLTEEQKQVLRDRLAAHREEKRLVQKERMRVHKERLAALVAKTETATYYSLESLFKI